MIIAKENGLTRARIIAGFSIAELARIANVNHSMICRAEAGKGVRPETAKKVCDALHSSFDDLFLIVKRRKHNHVSSENENRRRSAPAAASG